MFISQIQIISGAYIRIIPLLGYYCYVILFLFHLFLLSMNVKPDVYESYEYY